MTTERYVLFILTGFTPARLCEGAWFLQAQSPAQEFSVLPDVCGINCGKNTEVIPQDVIGDIQFTLVGIVSITADFAVRPATINVSAVFCFDRF